VAVGTVTGRDGITVTVVTASGELDQLSLTQATRVAQLVDGDSALAATGSRVSVEESSIGGPPLGGLRLARARRTASELDLSIQS
jgi:hypothetical protein